MPYVRGAVHGVAAMVLLVVGSVLTNAIQKQFEIFARLANITTHILIRVVDLPVSEEIASAAIPVGVLMSLWVFAYELRRI